MRFYINALVLWLKNGKRRVLHFENNKVNVITGESGTGKSEIISIIDYCFFASRVEITEKVINENTDWYGIQFCINDKEYTIARGSIADRKLSDDYYFSSVGDIPSLPKSNMLEKEIKKVIEFEFGITEKTVFSYGGNSVSLGSRISPRYFFMFSTQSGDVITHSEVFFDKQNIDRYREALGRVFDLAVGIETEENIILKEKIGNLSKEINSLNRKISVITKGMNIFQENIKILAQKAQEFNLLEYSAFDIDTIIPRLKSLVDDYKEENIDLNVDKLNELRVKKNDLIRKVRNLKRFKNQFETFRKVERETLDSLKPITAIKESYYRLHNLPHLDLLIGALADEYRIIKENIAGKPPFDFDVDQRIKEYESEIDLLSRQIFDIPIKDTKVRNEIDKLIFIGELKTKLDLYESQWDETEETAQLRNELEQKDKLKGELEKHVIDYAERKELTLRLLDELIQQYLDQSADAMPTYRGYKSAFQYKERMLKLRAPKEL